MPDLNMQSQNWAPAYRRVAHVLRERIMQGSRQEGEFLPPERALAAELKVSRQTIRLAIELLRQEGLLLPEQGRGTRIVLPQTAVVSRQECDERSFAALVIYGMSREGSAAIFQGCALAMQRANFHLVVAETAISVRQRLLDEAAQLQSLLDKGIRGIIIYAEPTDQNRSLLEQALDRGVQVVQIDRYLPGLPCDYVGVDNAAAAEEMTDHLIARGHRRIAFLSMKPEPSTCQERLQGYRASLRAHGLRAASHDLVACCSAQRNAQSEVNRILHRWLSSSNPPTAIFAVNDELALTVIQALQAQGRCVPDEVAVVGFDNQRAAGLISPPLTTIEQPFSDLGEAAAHLLLSRLMGSYTGEPRRILLPTRLVIRQSCGTLLRSAAAS
jgi:DNA-binding LacI/PurR family transcriptional regulator